jgi:hypothetical protein
MTVSINQYADFFGVNQRTASAMYKEDCRRNRCSRISIYKFAELYYITPVLLQQSAESCIKPQKLAKLIFG